MRLFRSVATKAQRAPVKAAAFLILSGITVAAAQEMDGVEVFDCIQQMLLKLYCSMESGQSCNDLAQLNAGMTAEAISGCDEWAKTVPVKGFGA